MTSPADFADLFDPCRNMHDANTAYKQALDVLREAHRLCMARIVKDRDSGVSGAKPKQEPQTDAQVALVVKQSHDAKVRNWAASQGISFKRVNKGLRALYDEAHGD